MLQKAIDKSKNNSINGRIFQALLSTGGFTILVKSVSLIKDIIIAAAFGLGDELDAYLMAFLLPNYLMNIVVSGVKSAFMPTYIKVAANEGDEAANHLFSNFLIITVALLLLVTLGLAIIGPASLAKLITNFSPAKQSLTWQLFYLMMPVVFLRGLTIIGAALLNAREQFALPVITQAAVPLSQIITFLLFKERMGVIALAWGLIIGLTIQILLISGVAIHQKLLPIPRFTGFSPAMRSIIGQYIPVLIGGTVVGSLVVVDKAFAAQLATGDVAALDYGNKLVSVIVAVTTMSLATAVLPYFSQLTAKEDWIGLRYTLKKYTQFVLVTSIPATVVLISVSGLIIKLMLQRGAFNADDAVLVSRVQQMYALQLPLLTVGMLYVRAISALRLNHILMWGTGLNFIINIVFNGIFYKLFGVAGIALSTSGVLSISTLYLGIMLYRHLGRVHTSST